MATAADIAAARRLIAQFEDRALGRHNSTFHRPSLEAQVAPLDVRDRHEVPTLGAVPSPPAPPIGLGVRMVEDYRSARVGECVTRIPGIGDGHSMLCRVYALPPPEVRPMTWRWAEELSPEVYAPLDVWEFERVVLVAAEVMGGESREVWKRIA